MTGDKEELEYYEPTLKDKIFRIIKALVALAVLMGFLYISGIYQYLLLHKTSSDMEQKKLADLSDAETIIVPLSILFGSYAKQSAEKGSDIDIYIETKDKKIKQGLEILDSNLSVKIGEYDKKNLLIREIEKNHVIVKGVEVYYEKNKFFK